ncbi:MAG: NADH oxidase [Candidatus Bathyarchaeota archaeon B26-2]|nr:MAG: NADH oxidase [Candidatus Bathyarchaeota archaeon B26-2]
MIIGANAAGTDAASAARKTDRKAEIILLTKEDKGAYSRCGLPFVLDGHIPSFENLIVYPSSFYKMMKLDLRLETEAKSIDTEAKTVEVEDKKGRSETLEYDSLIIATGAKPFIPPIEGIDKEGVFTLHTYDDGVRLVKAMKKAKTAAIIGSGLVGLETAVAFNRMNIKTTVIEMLPYILPRMLDKDMAGEVQKRLEEKGIKIMLGKPAEAIIGKDRAEAVSVGGEEVPADIVLNSAGVRPNTELAKAAGISIGETGGIKTNIRMQTSAEDVYAAGDCAETTHIVTGRPCLPLLGATAVREGKVAGINAAGGYTIFPGALCSAVSQLLDFEVGATGLTEFWASRFGVEVAVGKISGLTRAMYYPGAKPIKVKLLIEREEKIIVGGQIVGGEEVTQRINALSLAIQKRMTVYELIKADTCYAPSVCETWEPMVLAAEMALRRL